jgi:hypothetical protein
MAGITITQKVKERPKDTKLTRTNRKENPSPYLDKKLSHPQPF